MLKADSFANRSDTHKAVSMPPVLSPERMLYARLFYMKNRPVASFFLSFPNSPIHVRLIIPRAPRMSPASPINEFCDFIILISLNSSLEIIASRIPRQISQHFSTKQQCKSLPKRKRRSFDGRLWWFHLCLHLGLSLWFCFCSFTIPQSPQATNR